MRRRRVRFGRSLPWVILVAIVGGLTFTRELVVDPTLPGLDPSFRYAFNYASAHRLVWGRDFVSTYGPYGYVLFTSDVQDLPVRKLALALLLVVGASAAAAVYVWRQTALSAKVRLALLAFLLYAFSIQPDEYQWLAFLALVVLIGARTTPPLTVVAFGVAGLLAGFYVLVKFSLGLAGLLTVAAASVTVARPLLAVSRLGVASCAATGSFLIAWYSYGGRLGGIGEFLRTGWELSRGYSSAMSLAPDLWKIGAGCFLVWLLLLAVWVFGLRDSGSLVSLAVLGVPLFVAWKHTMVRQDPAIILLVCFGIFVMAILLVDAVTLRRGRATVVVVGLLSILLLTPWYVVSSGRPEFQVGDEDACRSPRIEGHLTQPLRLCGLRDLVSLWHFDAYRDRLQEQSRAGLERNLLPASIRSTIGTASVDVYPWEISYVPANGLSWANRPLPASFSAYTPRLDALNAAFFRSSRRPEYLLWHTHPRPETPLWSIDERHIFWDEPNTLRTILDTYDLVESNRGILLLRARDRPRFAAIRPLGSQTVAWNTWLAAPAEPDILLAKIVIEPSVVIRTLRAAFRENGLELLLRFSSGQQARFRIVSENAAEGLWLSPFPATVEELPNLLRSGAGRQVTAIRFLGGRLSRFYAPIVVSWYRVTLSGPTWGDALR